MLLTGLESKELGSQSGSASSNTVLLGTFLHLLKPPFFHGG